MVKDSISEKIKETSFFLASLLFLGIMFVIGFFVIILPRWVMGVFSKLRK